MRRRFRVLRLRFFAVFKAAASRDIQHIACKFDADFFEFLIAVSFQDFDGFLDLDGVSDGVAQRFIHIRDDRPCDFARLIADIDHNFCKREPFVKGFIERAAADFDVQNDAVRTRGEFLPIMLDAISGRLSTVAVTSRSAYSFCPQAQVPRSDR